MKRGGLGQGLASLLGPQALPNEGGHVSALQEVDISLVVRRENQPRSIFNQSEIEALAQSIRQNGLLQPILVREKENKTYEIIAGERRWRAAQLLEMKTLPVIIRDMSDEEVMVSSLVENLQREGLDPFEEARAYEAILKKMQITQESLGAMVGKSRSHIANSCRLLLLPDSIKLLVLQGDISIGHARLLIGKENAEEMALLMAQKKISVRQAEQLVQKNKGTENNDRGLAEKEKPGGKVYAKNAPDLTSPEEKEEIARIESFLEERLGHPVRIYVHKETTDVVFHLPSRENLDDLLAKLNTIAS